MRDIENLHIKYCGYSNPKSEDELDIEILGLEYAIKKIEARIAFLKQSAEIAKNIAKKETNEADNELHTDKNSRKKSY